jgi:enoyl-CoA hydratase
MPVQLDFRSDGRVAVVTISRPEAKNALDPATLTELANVWRRIGADEGVRAAVLTGDGDAFCAGMDLKKTIPAARRLASGERIGDDEFAGLRAIPAATLQTDRPKKPIVAAVNGHCRGQGTDILLATDYRISVPNATFALEEVSIGLFPRGNTTVMLPRQIPWARAVELALHVTGGWDAATALQAGLINEVIEEPALLERAIEVAERLASYEPKVVAAILDSMLKSAFYDDYEAAVRQSHKIADEITRE